MTPRIRPGGHSPQALTRLVNEGGSTGRARAYRSQAAITENHGLAVVASAVQQGVIGLPLARQSTARQQLQ